MRGLLRRFRNGEGGQALVEFALVVPLLMLLVVGIIEFGRAWNLHQAITDASREGARKAVVFDPAVTQDSVVNAVKTSIANVGYDPSKATITFPNGFKGKDASGNPTNLEFTTVRIAMPYRFTFLSVFVNLSGVGSNGSITLVTQSTMRNE